MTTFQDPPHQSRRAVRESEREERLAADAASEVRDAPAAGTPDSGAPASAHSVQSIASVASVASVVEPEPADAAPVVRSSGRRASRAAAQPGLIELQNTDGSSASAAAEGEPLEYATKGRRQVPSYDGPGPSFAQRLREAEASSSRQDSEAAAVANATGEQPQFRVRDFSPEGRRSAAYPSQPPPAAPTPAAEQAPADLDYRTQAAPVSGATPSAFVPSPSAPAPAAPPAADSTPAPADATTDLPALWSPRIAPAAPFPLVEPAAPASAFSAAPTAPAEAPVEAPAGAAAPASAGFPASAAAPESAAYPASAAAPSGEFDAPAAEVEVPEAEAPAAEEIAPEPVAPEVPEAEVAAPVDAQPATPQLPTAQTATPQFVLPAPQAPAVPAESYSASVSHPDSVAEASGVPHTMTRRELRELRAREEAAAAALIEPEVPVATPAAVSDAIAEFEELARAAQQATPEVVPAEEAPAEEFSTPETVAEAAPAEPVVEPAPPTSPTSLFSTNQPFSNWLPAEPVTPPAPVVEPNEQFAPAAPPVDSVASVHSAPVPLDALIADPEATPDTSVPRPFQWGPPSDDAAPAPEAVEPATPKSTPDPHATSFEELFAPVAAEPEAAKPEAVEPQPIAPASVPEARELSPDDLFSQALASAAPPAYEPPAYEAPAAEAPAAEAPKPVYEAPKFDFANYAPPSFSAEPSVEDVAETPAVEPELTLPAPPDDSAPSTNNPGTNNPSALPPFTTASTLVTPTPAATPQDFLTPDFVEPPTTTASTYVAPVGHWSRQAIMDDETQPFENTLSREVGGGNVSTTTSALILPSIPQQDLTTGLSGTGEILVTGTIALPESFGTMGGDSRRYDNPDVDHVLDAFDNEVVSTDSAPVRATRAVSTHTNTHGVIHAAKPNGDRLLKILLIAASGLAVVVVALLVIGLNIN